LLQVANGIEEALVRFLIGTQSLVGINAARRRLVALSEEAARDDPFIEFVGAWFDPLPARSTLGYTQDNFRA
jgi:hypothetical protein